MAAFSLAALALVAACSSGPSQSAVTSTTTPAASDAAKQLGDTFRPGVKAAMEAMLVPGAVVLVETPQGRWLEAFGTRRLGANDPVTVDDHFRVGSNTKTMTGTVILQLVQEGKMKLEDPVAKYRPEVPNGQNITIAQLLSMTSGLDSYTFLDSFEQVLDSDPTKAWQPEELAKMGEQLPPKFAPGQGFLYSNTNTVLLGLIIEKITGQKLANVFSDRIFTKLKMNETLFPAITDGALPKPYPQGYLFGTNVSTTTSAVMSDADQAAAKAGTLKPNDVTNLNPSWGWAAGAAISTARDLATYVKVLVGGGLLDQAMQKTRLDSLKPPQPGAPTKYGLALAQFGPFIGHDGSLPGYQSFMGFDPATSSTIIVLTNLQTSPDGKSTANEIGKGIIAGLAKG